MSTIFYILSIIACIYTLLDIWQKSDLDQTKKIIWTVLAIITSWLGIVLYWLIGKKK